MPISQLLSNTPRSPALEIAHVEFLLAGHKLSSPIPLSCGELTHRNFGIVRIRTRGGVIGLGETSVNFPPWCIHERRATIEDGLADLILGKNALDVEVLWHAMRSATRAFTRIWAEGAILQAISGVDMALWDIAGQELGVPVHVLLGDKKRDSVECYAVGFSAEDPGAGAVELQERGYRNAKMRIGFNEPEDLRKAREMRTAVGPDFGMMIDANQAYDLDAAKPVMTQLEPLNLRWLEEPILNDDHAGYADLRGSFPSIPIAWGENSFRQAEVETYTDANLIDFYMPDPCRSGGITGALHMAHAAQLRGAKISPHHYGSDLGFSACLHLAVVLDDFDLMLRDEADVPLRGALFGMPFSVENGSVTVPNKPGLGLELDPHELSNSLTKLN